MNINRTITPIAFLIAAAGATPVVAQDGETTVLLVTGDTVPGGGPTFTDFMTPGDPPVLGEDGRVAFEANLSDGGTGVFRAHPGGVNVIARDGDTPPDGNGSFTAFFGVAIADGGSVGFAAAIEGTDIGDDTGFYRGDGSSTVRTVRIGQPAPNDNGDIEGILNRSYANQPGRLAFEADTTTADRAIVLADDAALTEIARKGQSTPDGSRTFIDIDFGAPALNEAGEVVFYSDLSGLANGNGGIYRGDGSDVVTIAQNGDPAPDGDGQFGGFGGGGSVAINDSGTVAFFASRINNSGGDEDGFGIFRGDADSTDYIALKGDAAPDGNGVINIFRQAPTINASGQVLIEVSLEDTSGTDDEQVLLIGNGNSLTRVARSGEPVPGDSDVLFGTDFDDFAINDAGQVAFEVELLDTPDDVGIFLYDGDVTEVVRAGDSLLGSEITDVDMLGSDGFRGLEQAGFNQSGEVAFVFELADGRQGIAQWGSSTACPPDADGDGNLNYFDVAAFIADFNNGADYNGDGQTDFNDVSDFIDDFTAGCP